MYKIIFKKINLILSVCGLIFLAVVFLDENASANIENNVSATANTGGNKIEGSGTIKTGNATASAKAENSVNGAEKVQNNVQAKAEVQGAGAQASVDVNGEKKSCEATDGETCAAEINNTITDSSSADTAVNPEKTGNADGADKNIIQTVASAVFNIAKSITDKIISWLA